MANTTPVLRTFILKLILAIIFLGTPASICLAADKASSSQLNALNPEQAYEKLRLEIVAINKDITRLNSLLEQQKSTLAQDKVVSTNITNEMVLINNEISRLSALLIQPSLIQVKKSTLEQNINKAITKQDVADLKISKLEVELIQLKSTFPLQEQHISDVISLMGVLGTLITVLLLMIGFFTYRDSRKDAKRTAEAEVKSFIAEHKSALSAQQNEFADILEKKADTYYSSITRKSNEIELRAKEITAVLEENRKEAQSHVKSTKKSAKQLRDLLADISKQPNTFINNEASDTSEEESHNDLQVLFKEALSLYENKELEQSLEKLNVILASTTDKTHENLITAVSYNKGICLTELNKIDEALTTYDGIINKDYRHKNNGLIEIAAQAAENSGALLVTNHLIEQAIEMYSKAIDLAQLLTGKSRALHLAKAMYLKAKTINIAGDTKKSLILINDFLAKYKSTEDINIQPIVINAFRLKLAQLSSLDHGHELEHTQNDLLSIFEDSTEPSIHSKITLVLVLRVSWLFTQDRFLETLALADRTIERIGDLSSKQSLEVQLKKGQAQGALKQYEAAKQTFTTIENITNTTTTVVAQEFALRAKLEQGIISREIGDKYKAISIMLSVLNQIEHNNELSLQSLKSSTLLNIGYSYTELMEYEPAAETYELLISEFEHNEDPYIIGVFTCAILNRIEIAIITGSLGEAEFYLGLASESIPAESNQKAIVLIFSYLIKDITYQELVSNLEALSKITDMKTLSWSIKELESYIEKLEEPEKHTVNMLFEYVNSSKDISTLKALLR